jgi:glycosyltransferase involved in cell wall biosynthesis
MSLLETKIPNVTVHGEVEDATEFIHRHSVMIVPLFSGSGMRVKIVEGMIMGKVIITTSLGKEGIQGEDHKHFLVADRAEDFIHAVSFCVEHPDQAMSISAQAQENASLQFDGGQAAQKILAIYESLLGYENHSGKNPVRALTS